MCFKSTVLFNSFAKNDTNMCRIESAKSLNLNTSNFVQKFLIYLSTYLKKVKITIGKNIHRRTELSRKYTRREGVKRVTKFHIMSNEPNHLIVAIPLDVAFDGMNLARCWIICMHTYNILQVKYSNCFPKCNMNSLMKIRNKWFIIMLIIWTLNWQREIFVRNWRHVGITFPGIIALFDRSKNLSRNILVFPYRKKIPWLVANLYDIL